MALYAPVAPYHLYKKMKKAWGEDSLGRYHLVLAHDIVEHADEWKELLPKNSTVIIDNSVIELGKAVAHELLAEAHNILGDRVHRILVLPDTFDEASTTFLDSYECLKTLIRKPVIAEFMYLIQVKDREQIPYALELWKREKFFQKHVRWIGIPRRIADNLGSRMEALLLTRLLQLEEPDLKIHLFGFSNNVPDDMRCAREPGVYGIDSAVPLRMGQQGKNLQFDVVGDQAGPRLARGNPYWNDKDAPLRQMTLHNLARVRSRVYGQ